MSDPRPRLLVVGTGGREYREYLLASIGARHRVHLFLGAEPSWEREHVSGWTVLDLDDTVDADALIDAARQVASAGPVHGVLSWDEARVLQVAKVAEALGLPGGDPAMVLRCRDKHLTREALAAAGVPQPRSVLAHTVAEALAAAERIGYPVVLKPRALAASLGVVLVGAADELAARFAFARDTTVPGAWRYDAVLVEEYATGPEISVDSAVHRGRAYPMFVARKEIGYPPYFEEVGHVVDAADPLLSDPAVLAIVQDTHTGLGFTDGMTHTELRLTPTGPKVIEVNARLGGDLIPYLGLRATGTDPGLAAAAVACGRPPDVAARRALVGAVRFFYVDDDDTTVAAIEVDTAALPAAVDRVVPLAGPGDVVSPPPKGTLWGRVAFATATAATAGECRAALDAAAAALTVRTVPVPTAVGSAAGSGQDGGPAAAGHRYAIVVDPLGTGQEYPAAFAEAGVEVVAVLSRPEPIALYAASWHPENFRHVHVWDGDPAGVPALAGTLCGYHPLCLIAGSETGVELAEALVQLVVPGTGHRPELAAARRDKWAMAEAVRAAGVPHLRQLCSAEPTEIAAWLADTGLAGDRIVLKPPKSAATDNVHLVAAGEDWRPVFDLILGKMNEFGLRNDAVLVQEFAAGTEYLIDSYSVDGRHGLVDVCRYSKQQRGDRIGVYDLVDFLPADHPDVAGLWAYARRVLDAVGVRNGCCHTEVIATPDGPRLLEVGARPAGGGHQMITKLATGTNHIERTVAHRVRGEFDPSYELVRYVCSVVISSPRAGTWRNADVFDGVESLPTFHVKHFYYGSGDTVPAPAGLSSMLGWVVLASPDHEAMQADYRRIRELERQVLVTDAEPSLAVTPR